MNLDTALNQFVNEHFPGILAKRILLAVSGGPDSMALLRLFASLPVQIAVAHCNFGLRGTQSDQDELFVQQQCAELNVHCYSKRFETMAYAETYSVSIQVAARELRYAWFDQLCQEFRFDHVATAHHLDDNVETILMNMVRGTGIKGITGIPVSNGTVIRPLLFAGKNELTDYLNTFHFPFRTDASNEENKYTRNKLRNMILPHLTGINTQAVLHIHQLSKHAAFAYSLIREKTDELATRYLRSDSQSMELNYGPIASKSFASFYLHELIHVYGFNPVQCEDIHRCFTEAKTGSRFLTDTHELIVNRQFLIITPLAAIAVNPNKVLIHKLPVQTFVLAGNTYRMELKDASAIQDYEQGNLYISADMLSFPLTCRVWEYGDQFRPLGAPGTKKVSDYLTDLKISLHDKRMTYVLEDPQNGIIALLNHRIADQYKLTPHTQLVLFISKKGDHES